MPHPAILLVIYLLVSAMISVIFKFVAIGPGGLSVVDLTLTPLFYAGCALQVIQTVIWIAILRSLPLSKAYPFTSLNVALAILCGSIFFGEMITISNIVGSIVIIVGIMIISSEKHTACES